MQTSSSSKKGLKNLEGLFMAKSVAVIGASPNPKKIGHQILRNIVEGGYQGEIFPIHPKEKEILGKKAYPSVLDVPQDIDLAVIAVPAPLVASVMKECGQKGVKALSVITSGFAEIGKVEEEKELKRIADSFNMALCGPNTFGIVYSPANLNTSFGPRVILPGKIAFISQSGALAIALMGWTGMEKIGLAALVNLGNKADIEESELIEYFNGDNNVDVILIYMEGVRDGKKFMQTKIKKPVVVLKVGCSKRGAKAAASHTGSLAGSDSIYEAAFKQLGILRAKSFTEAFAWSQALSLPTPKGDDAVIITNGGGIGVRTTDECEKMGIKLLEDPQWLESKFRSTMPEFGSTKNPIDITGQGGAEQYRKAVKMALTEDKIHALIVLYCETVITNPLEIAKAVYEEYQSSGKQKPVVVAMVGGDRTREALYYLNEHHIPAFTSISTAVSALRVLYRWQEISSRKPEHPEDITPPKEAVAIIDQAKKEGRSILMEHEARKVLELCGVPTPKWGFASSVEEAKKVAKGMYPLAMKIASEDIIHKTDVGGVALNIRSEEELIDRYEEMMSRIKEAAPSARIRGVNLVQMVNGIECIVGMSRDPQFGPVVMFGLGGIFVEVLKDVSFRVVPFGRQEAGRLLNEIKAKKVLEGFRGMVAHKESLMQTLCAVQKIASIAKEVDINPLMTNASGSYAVDARIVL